MGFEPVFKKYQYDSALRAFVVDSNKIEGIQREPTDEEIEAHSKFLALDRPTVDDMVALVGVLQPDAKLRNATSVHGVRVGGYVAPPSGPEIQANLETILERAVRGDSPWEVHCQHETLHPFTDGNGRSGRALWAWQMNKRVGTRLWFMDLGFLHSFYYQTLNNFHG